MRSKSRFTSKALRRGVPLNTMCSRKCDTPHSAGISSRDPVRTKKPMATERAEGATSPMMVRPLGRVWFWNIYFALYSQRAAYEVSGRRSAYLVRGSFNSGYVQRRRPQRHHGEVLCRV